jgi:hypothetical protein
MKPLEEIKSFPGSQRDVLQQQFGITSAEAFFEHGKRNASGVQKALNITTAEHAELMQLVEGYLSPEFVKRCSQPVAKHSRGVIVD